MKLQLECLVCVNDILQNKTKSSDSNKLVKKKEVSTIDEHQTYFNRSLYILKFDQALWHDNTQSVKNYLVFFYLTILS